MTIETLSELCKSLPSVETDIKWEHHLCFTIGTKIFLMISLDEIPSACSFKVSDEEFETITELPGVIPAPYMARNKWVKVDDLTRFSVTDWQKFVKDSFELVSSKLSKKKQIELEIIR